MLSFKPKEKSALQKLAENLTVQIIVLLLIGVGAGSYLIRKSPTSDWSQKSERTYLQQNKIAKATNTDSTAESNSAGTADANLPALENKEITINSEASESLVATQPSSGSLAKTVPAHQADPSAATKNNDSKEIAADQSVLTFRLTYAEVSNDVLQKWIADSSQAGLFQNLQSYSVGIITDYTKRNDKIVQFLKTAEKKLNLGQSETNLSGSMSDDGSQMIGLSVIYDFKSVESGSAHGNITVSRMNRQIRESYPSEFDLPKGAALFIVDTLTSQNFLTEKRSLNMAPFQVFKSPDFMTQKSKFVILLEPVN